MLHCEIKLVKKSTKKKRQKKYTKYHSLTESFPIKKSWFNEHLRWFNFFSPLVIYPIEESKCLWLFCFILFYSSFFLSGPICLIIPFHPPSSHFPFPSLLVLSSLIQCILWQPPLHPCIPVPPTLPSPQTHSLLLCFYSDKSKLAWPNKMQQLRLDEETQWEVRGCRIRKKIQS